MRASIIANTSNIWRYIEFVGRSGHEVNPDVYSTNPAAGSIRNR
jgi:hypothetical protein